MSDIQTSTIRVPKNVLEDIKIYCRKAGQPVGEHFEWVVFERKKLIHRNLLYLFPLFFLPGLL